MCAICTQPTAEGPFCEACLALRPVKAEGFTGLMMLALVGLIAVPLFTLSEAAQAVDPIPWWWFVVSVPHALLAVCTLPLYVMKRRIARYLMLSFYGIAVLGAVSEVEADHTAAFRIGVGVAWLGYFATSDRVKRVLVK